MPNRTLEDCKTLNVSLAESYNPSEVGRIVGSRTWTQLDELVKRYTELFHRDLIFDVRTYIPKGDFKDAVLDLLRHPAISDAESCRIGMDGLGTDERLLSEILCTRSNHGIQALAFAYKAAYNIELLDELTDETSGDLRLIYQTLLAGRGTTNDAKCIDIQVDQLYRAGEATFGTDEETFVKIIAGSSPEHVQLLAEAYEKKYHNSLVQVIEDEFSGDERFALLALVKPSEDFFAEELIEAFKGEVDERICVRIIVSQRESLLPLINSRLIAKGSPGLPQLVNQKTSEPLKGILQAVCDTFLPHAVH